MKHTAQGIRANLETIVEQCTELMVPILVCFTMPNEETVTLFVGTHDYSAKYAANALDVFAQQTDCKHVECAAATLIAMLGDRTKEPQYSVTNLGKDEDNGRQQG